MKYGSYTVIHEAGKKCGMKLVLCRCDCGTERLVYLKNLKSGNSRSCGCLRDSKTSERNLIHGMAWTPTWTVWQSMKRRCSPKADGKDYEWYYKRGIRVCDRWASFQNFIADMGERPPGMSIERIDNNKGYSPDNCRWATAKEQARNTRRNRMIDIQGQTKSLAEWLDALGVKKHTFYNRVKRGMSELQALGV